MKAIHARAIKEYMGISTLYSAGIGVWAGTIYLHMRNVHFSYGQIDGFLIIFWIVTFFAELPSGVIADSFGRMETVIVSSIIRAAGLFLIFINQGNFSLLLCAAVLTGLGDSLYSGAPDSWLVDQLKTEHSENLIGKTFSKINTVASVSTLISGYIGAQWVAKWGIQYPLLIGSILLLLIIPIALQIILTENKSKNGEINSLSFKERIMEVDPLRTFWDGIHQVRDNKTLLGYMIAFLPISFIVTGPFNQWQLFFQKSGTSLTTGNILIGVNIMGILGAYIVRWFFSGHNSKLLLISVLTAINTLTVILSVLVGNFYIAVAFFWLHVLVTSSDEVTRYTILQNTIESSKARSTIISLNNTLTAGMTILALGINGFISDKLGIGAAWIVSGLFGGILSLLAYFIMGLKKHRDEEIKKDI
jgi:MFS family permease